MSLISQIAVIKERNVFKDMTISHDFSPDDQETHFSVYLKTFFTLTKDENGRTKLKCNLDHKEKWETMHLYLRILKRYYTLINILTEACDDLKQAIKILINNTSFKNYFDVELFSKFLFIKLVQEDFLISQVVEIAELYVEKMNEEDDEDK